MEATIQSKPQRLTLYLSAILLIIIGSGIFYFYNKSTQITNPSSTKKVVVSTIGWQTYSNPVHHLSFTYPPDWELKLENDQLPSLASVRLVKNDAFIHMIFGLDQIEGSGAQYEGTPYLFAGHNVYMYKTLNSKTGLQNIGLTDVLSNSHGVLNLGGKTYAINLFYPSSYAVSEESATIEATFDQILSSFKFTNQ
ncbi:MAG: hypothetical protein WAV40_04275 [Microgenomates group bacterium]